MHRHHIVPPLRDLQRELNKLILEHDLNFNRGNIVKYIARAPHKGTELQDLEKAQDYLKREIEYLRNKQKEWIETNK